MSRSRLPFSSAASTLAGGDTHLPLTPIGADEADSLMAGLEGLRLAICVSGGADSLAAMHLIAEWARRQDDRGAPPSDIIVLTVDHGLREASLEEARFVSEAAAALGLCCRILNWEGEKPATGVQEAAREARRRLLGRHVAEEWLTDGPSGGTALEGTAGLAPRRLVMAHHLEDHAETVLMRLVRGSGPGGLSGMRFREAFDVEVGCLSNGDDGCGLPELPDVTGTVQVEILRPFLRIAKGRLKETLRLRGLSWVSDPSNLDERYERVRLRNEMAAFERMGLSAQAISRSASRIAAGEAALSRIVDAIVAYACERGPLCARIPLQALDAGCWFSGWPPALRDRATGGDGRRDLQSEGLPDRELLVRVLARLLPAYGGATAPAELSQIEALCGDLIGWYPGAGREKFGRTLGGCRIESQRRPANAQAAGAGVQDGTEGAVACDLMVFREFGRLAKRYAPFGEDQNGRERFVLEPGEARAWDGGRFRVSAAADLDRPVEVVPLGALGLECLGKSAGLKAAYQFSNSVPKGAAMAAPGFVAGGRLLVASFEPTASGIASGGVHSAAFPNDGGYGKFT